MPKQIRVQMNPSGAQKLLNSPEVVADMGRRAAAIAAASGAGYVGDGQPGKTRAHGMARTDSFSSMRDNARNNTLMKNLSQGAT